MKPFSQLKTSQQVYDLMGGVGPLPAENVALASALGRTLAGPVISPEDLPGFARATRDGYAVRAGDTRGASQAAPARLALRGRIFMGQPPDFSLEPGQCAAIPTGGMLPGGADAVVMMEHASLLDSGEVEVAGPAEPGLNTLGPADDAARGQELLPAGRRLRPQDLGLMAALGLEHLEVVRRPRVGIISTGDELIPRGQKPAPGQVRDANAVTISGLVSQAGGQPVVYAPARDSLEDLEAGITQAMEECDLVCLSGGSSVGARDLTAQVLLSFDQARPMVRGVAVFPGKPFTWVAAEAKHLLGLPGPAGSCLTAFHLFVDPMLERLLGRPAKPFTRFARVTARLRRDLPSVPGREDYVSVQVSTENGQPVAEPVRGKSGLLRSMVPGAGLLKVPLDSPGFPAHSLVEVMLYP